MEFNIKSIINTFILAVYACIISLHGAFAADSDIRTLLTNNASLKQGQEQFLLHCAGCHKKDLSGSVGFNLKDGEWIHGGEPSQILHSIQQGFDKAGMPGFGNILAEKDQLAITAYILSKRQGFENLHYKIYQLDDAQDVTFNESDLIKSGVLKNNIADFELPEVAHYALEFSGQFHGPKNEKAFLYAERIKDLNIVVELNGKALVPVTYSNVQKWLLNKGRQDLTLTFYSGKASAYLRNIALYVVNEDSSIKLFPVSSKALAESKDTKFEVKATGDYVVQQKKIVKLPAYSIAIGSPEKINYAFNTKTCALNGVWEGDLLNVGPNIGGRGKDGSIPLGDWLFHFPEQIVPKLASDSQHTCVFEKYRLTDHAPEFYFTLNGVSLMLTTDFSVANQARFIYRVLANQNNVSQMEMGIPSSDSLFLSSEQGQRINDGWLFDIKAYSNFSIQMTWSGDK